MNTLAVNKIGFVILHYMNSEDTIKCIESIKEMNYQITGIVVVDNHSANGSLEILRERYLKCKKIKILYLS